MFKAEEINCGVVRHEQEVDGQGICEVYSTGLRSGLDAAGARCCWPPCPGTAAVVRHGVQHSPTTCFLLRWPPCSVEEHGFNISAPHIHATALETLDLSAGDRWVRGSPFLLECHRQHL